MRPMPSPARDRVKITEDTKHALDKTNLVYTTTYLRFLHSCPVRFVMTRPVFSARRGNGKESTAIRHPVRATQAKTAQAARASTQATNSSSSTITIAVLQHAPPPPLTLSSGLMFVSKETSFFSTSPTDGPPVLISGMATPAAMFSFCFQYQSRNGKGIQSGTAAVRVYKTPDEIHVVSNRGAPSCGIPRLRLGVPAR